VIERPSELKVAGSEDVPRRCSGPRIGEREERLHVTIADGCLPFGKLPVQCLVPVDRWLNLSTEGVLIALGAAHGELEQPP